MHNFEVDRIETCGVNFDQDLLGLAIGSATSAERTWSVIAP
jgi:hypothetical protein